MTKKNTIGTILGSVFITLLLVGVGGYFGLPVLFPNLNADLGDYAKTEDLTDEGIILQTKYNESRMSSIIEHTDQVYEKMPGIGLNITTRGNSKLNVAFEGIFLLQLGTIFQGNARYNITLDISGVGNRTTGIIYYQQLSEASVRSISDNVHISFETEILPAGTYSISVYWKSIITASADYSKLLVLDNYPRSIFVQEIAG